MVAGGLMSLVALGVQDNIVNKQSPRMTKVQQNILKKYYVAKLQHDILKKYFVVFDKNKFTIKKYNGNIDNKICPITYENIKNPAYLVSCGHIYEKEAIVTWVRDEDSCPMCRKNVNLFDRIGIISRIILNCGCLIEKDEFFDLFIDTEIKNMRKILKKIKCPTCGKKITEINNQEKAIENFERKYIDKI